MSRSFSAFFLMIGLSLSACQSKTAEPEDIGFEGNIARLGDVIVARVDGTNIYMSDVERAAAAQNLIAAGAPLTTVNPLFERVLDELIDQRLLALRARKLGLDQDDEVQRRLSTARERILGNALVENHLADRVNETTVRRLYEEQSVLQALGPERRVRHILVNEEDQIKDVAARLAKGESFTALASELSLDRATREHGGDLGFISKDMLGPVFTRVAFATALNEVSDPFETDFGWHVLRPEASRTAPTPSFEDMRSEIMNFMTYDEIQKLLTGLRKEGEVVLSFQSSNPPLQDQPTDVTVNETPEPLNPDDAGQEPPSASNDPQPPDNLQP